MRTAGPILLVVLIIAFSGNVKPAGGAAPDKPTPVTVVNSILPVSVMGDVPVHGPVDAAQSGNWNVGINGTPTVQLAPGTTVPVATSPGAFDIPLSGFGMVNTSGKRMVVECVTGTGTFGIDDSGKRYLGFVNLRVENGSTHSYIVPFIGRFLQFSDSDNGTHVEINELTKIYIEAGDEVDFYGTPYLRSNTNLVLHGHYE
jgi:hypothetical protein